jgi:hypothetical protein
MKQLQGQLFPELEFEIATGTLIIENEKGRIEHYGCLYKLTWWWNTLMTSFLRSYGEPETAMIDIAHKSIPGRY